MNSVKSNAPSIAQTYARDEAPPDHLAVPALQQTPHVRGLRSGNTAKADPRKVLDSLSSMFEWSKRVASNEIVDLPVSSVRLLGARAKALLVKGWDATETRRRLTDAACCGRAYGNSVSADVFSCGLVGCGRLACYRLSHDKRIAASRAAVTEAQIYADEVGRPLVMLTLNMDWAVPAYEGSSAPVLHPLGGAVNALWLRANHTLTGGFAGKNLLQDRMAVLMAARDRFRVNWAETKQGPVWWWMETAWRETSVPGQRWLPQPHLHVLVVPDQSLSEDAFLALWGGCGDARAATKPMMKRDISFGAETTRVLGRYLAKGATGIPLARLARGDAGSPAIRCSDLAAYLDDRSLLEWVEGMDGSGLKTKMSGRWGAAPVGTAKTPTGKRATKKAQLQDKRADCICEFVTEEVSVLLQEQQELTTDCSASML